MNRLRGFGGVDPVLRTLRLPCDLGHEVAAIDWCRSRLARYKVPVRVTAVVQFPITAGANEIKVQNAKLRELAATALR